MKPALLTLLTFLVTLVVDGAKAPNSMPAELKCSACWMVARSFGKGMRKTSSPSKTIQTGHRLSGDNKLPRKQYVKSEVRVFDVMEELCPKRKYSGYEIGEEDGETFFSKDTKLVSKGRDSEGFLAAERNVAGMLENYCYMLADEYEEEIEELVREEATSRQFRLNICKNAAKVCTKISKKKKQVTPPTDMEEGTGTTTGSEDENENNVKEEL